MTNEERTQLIEAAEEAAEHAYARYSGFPVGAAVLTEDGCIYGGCNVENASYGLSLCGERVAMVRAIAEGHARIRGLVLLCNDARTPCGACLQFLGEFTDDMQVIVLDSTDRNHVKEYRFKELHPHPFNLD